jgi:drug/metabolite transporter (DMT)-like permease
MLCVRCLAMGFHPSKARLAGQFIAVDLSGPRGPLHWPGVLLALAPALLFGAVAPLSKLLLNTVSPFMLAGLMYLGAGLGLAGYRLSRGVYPESAEEAQLRRTDIPWLAVAIGMGGVVEPVLLILGLSRATASTSALLLNTEGLATMAIA